jgi:hypothetical protein
MHKQLPDQLVAACDHTTHSTNDQESRPTRVSSHDAGAPRSMIREMEGPERIVTAVGVGFLLVSAAMLWSGSPLHKDVKTNAGHVAARLLGRAAPNVGTHGSTATASTDDCGISLLHTPARLPLASTTTPRCALYACTLSLYDMRHVLHSCCNLVVDTDTFHSRGLQCVPPSLSIAATCCWWEKGEREHLLFST